MINVFFFSSVCIPIDRLVITSIRMSNRDESECGIFCWRNNGRYPTRRRWGVVFSSIAWLSTPWAYKICAEIVLAKGSVLQTVAWLASVRLPMPMIHDVASQFRHSPAQYTRKQMFYSCFHSWNATIFLGDNSTSNMDICNNDIIDALQICLSVASAFSKLWGFRSSKYRRLWVCLLQCTTPMSTSND